GGLRRTVVFAGLADGQLIARLQAALLHGRESKVGDAQFHSDRLQSLIGQQLPDNAPIVSLASAAGLNPRTALPAHRSGALSGRISCCGSQAASRSAPGPLCDVVFSKQ